MFTWPLVVVVKYVMSFMFVYQLGVNEMAATTELVIMFVL